MSHNVSLNNYKKIPESKIKAWVEKYFPDFKPRKNGDEYCINNPFNADTGYHMNIAMNGAGVHDWRSDSWAGPINPITNKRNCSFLKFVKLYLDCTYQEAIRDILGASSDLNDYFKSLDNADKEKEKTNVAVTLPPNVEMLHGTSDLQGQMLIKWLISRGYELSDINKHNILYYCMDVCWPYYEFDDLVYWQSRNRMRKTYRFPDINVLDESGQVIGKTEGSKGDFLYGFDDCEFASYAVITESIFGQYTLYDQALASGGASLTLNQIKKLKVLNPCKGIILSPDNDKAGIKSIISNYKLLSSTKFPIYYSIPPKIEYEADGKKVYTKDWNELVTGPKLSRQDIRKIHDDNIKKINIMNINKLHDMLK